MMYRGGGSNYPHFLFSSQDMRTGVLHHIVLAAGLVVCQCHEPPPCAVLAGYRQQLKAQGQCGRCAGRGMHTDVCPERQVRTYNERLRDEPTYSGPSSSARGDRYGGERSTPEAEGLPSGPAIPTPRERLGDPMRSVSTRSAPIAREEPPPLSSEEAARKRFEGLDVSESEPVDDE